MFVTNIKVQIPSKETLTPLLLSREISTLSHVCFTFYSFVASVDGTYVTIYSILLLDSNNCNRVSCESVKDPLDIEIREILPPLFC